MDNRPIKSQKKKIKKQPEDEIIKDPIILFETESCYCEPAETETVFNKCFVTYEFYIDSNVTLLFNDYVEEIKPCLKNFIGSLRQLFSKGLVNERLSHQLKM